MKDNDFLNQFLFIAKRGVSYQDICRGEVFGYLGHNGAGKSTSVKLLSAEEPVQEGSVTYNMIDGASELGNPDHVGRIQCAIGVCPQHNDSLQENLTCRETLRLFAQLKGRIPKQSKEQTNEEAIEEEIGRRLEDIAFTSAGDADKEIGTYSGGMKRKVSIAIALLGSPECVFLDEPTAGKRIRRCLIYSVGEHESHLVDVFFRNGPVQ